MDRCVEHVVDANKETIMNQHLVKLAVERLEKRAVLANVAKLLGILLKTPAGARNIPRVKQLVTELPDIAKLLNTKNFSKYFPRGGGIKIPGMKPPPPPPGFPGFARRLPDGSPIIRKKPVFPFAGTKPPPPPPRRIG